MSNYKPSSEIADKLSAMDESTRETVTDCLNLWSWISDVNNSEPQEPIANDDPKIRELVDHFWKNSDQISFLSPEMRMFSPYRIGRVFRKHPKEQLEILLGILKSIGVISQEIYVPSGGRAREMRYIHPDWQVVDNPAAFAKLESELFDLLVKALEPAAEQVTEPQAEPEPTAPKQPEALRILADMWVSMNGLTGFSLKAGSIINSVDNYSVFSWLLSTGAPVAPVDDKLAAVCTSCKARFDLDESLCVGAQGVIFFRDSYFNYNGVPVRRSAGSIESDYHLCRYALDKNLARWCNSEEVAVCPRCSAVMLRSELGLGGLSAQQYAAVNKPVQRIDQESAQPVSSAPVVSGTCGVSSKSTSQSDKQFKPYADPIRQAHDDDNMNKWLDKRFPG